MEHTASSTLIREPEAELGDESLSEWPGTPQQAAAPEATSGGQRSLLRRFFGEATIVSLLALGLYLTIAWFLDIKYHSFSPDAVSRMANGFYILYSGDQHLAAVGFVWQPLQSIADMVFLLGNHIWPALSHENVSGSLVSALGMAGAVYQTCRALREWGVTRTPRLVLVAFFALNPMILLYGGNGMSEGLYIFTLVASTRYLLRWVQRGDLRSLAYSAVWLGFSYLTRNEAILGVVLGAAVVAAVSYSRAEGRRQSRAGAAMSDVVIFAAPPFIAAAGWAIASYVITGAFFAQFSSIYGSSEQEGLLTHMTVHGRILYQVHAVEALAPLLPILLIASVVVAFVRRDPRVLAPLAVLGGALGFDMLAFMDNGIQNFFRYWIVLIPLEVFVIGGLIVAVQTTAPSGVGSSGGTRSSRVSVRMLSAFAAICLVLVAMIPASVKTGAAMFNPKIGVEETRQLGFIFHKHLGPTDLAYKNNFRQILAIDSYLSDLRLPNHDIVVDNFPECVPPILTTISQPKLFVIPNDRDYERTLADPIAFHAHYILEADPAGFPNTSINLEYPRLWTTGSEFTQMVHNFPSRSACPAFRLFHVLRHSNSVT